MYRGSETPSDPYFDDAYFYYDKEPDFATGNPSLAPLIASNDVPQPAQLAVLWQIRREHRAALLKVTTELSGIASALETLHARESILLREKRVLRLEQRQCIGLMSPIRRLPPEILGEIFLYFTPVLCTDLRTNHQSRSSRSDPRPSEIPWYLGQICQYWRRVALSLRPLWSVFDLSYGRRSKKLESIPFDLDSLMDAAEATHSYDDDDESDDYDYWDFSQQLHATWPQKVDVQGHVRAEAQMERFDCLGRSKMSTAIKAEKRRHEEAFALASLELSLQRTGAGPFTSRLISSGRAIRSLDGVLEGVFRHSHRLGHLVFVDAPPKLLYIFSQSSGNCPQLRRLELVFTTVTALPPLVWPPALTELVLTKVDLSDAARADDIPWAQLSKYRETECRWPGWGRTAAAARRVAYQRLQAGVVDLRIDFTVYKSREEVLMEFEEDSPSSARRWIWSDDEDSE
ncbi:hypothetical protein C8R46DRAFT_447366 [Mycena filopes]|nr:hypothetical protein C8R46DRAFT_447366 [Mycena filopes]